MCCHNSNGNGNSNDNENEALACLCTALETELHLARKVLVDFAANEIANERGKTVVMDTHSGLMSAGGLLLQLDVDELIYTGGLLLHVVQIAPRCGHRTLTLFEGFEHKYPSPKRCPRCQAEHHAEHHAGREAKKASDAASIADLLVAAGAQ